MIKIDEKNKIVTVSDQNFFYNPSKAPFTINDLYNMLESLMNEPEQMDLDYFFDSPGDNQIKLTDGWKINEDLQKMINKGTIFLSDGDIYTDKITVRNLMKTFKIKTFHNKIRSKL
jgi:hypothetical protein